jgi:hypothetical protein
MTERAQKVKEAFWGSTEYPDDLDECSLANALREVVIEVVLKYMQYAEWEIVNKIMEDINELADELEELK